MHIYISLIKSRMSDQFEQLQQDITGVRGYYANCTRSIFFPSFTFYQNTGFLFNTQYMNVFDKTRSTHTFQS